MVINIAFRFHSVRVSFVRKASREQERGSEKKKINKNKKQRVFVAGVMEIPDTISTRVLDISLSLSRALLLDIHGGVGMEKGWVWDSLGLAHRPMKMYRP